jgi:P4 family phage/plasmid primase-like protien
MDIDLGEKVKPRFSKKHFDWFVTNGFEEFLKLAGKIPANSGRWRPVRVHDAIKTILSQGFNLGVLIPHGRLVIDIDKRKGGLESFAKLLVEAYRDDPSAPTLDDLINCTFAVRTGGGGYHLYFSHDPSRKPKGSTGFQGVDLKSSSRQYVVAPGGVHPGTGMPYQVVSCPELIAELPEQLAPYVLTEIRDPHTRKASTAADHPLWGVASSSAVASLLDALDPKEFRSYVGDSSSWLNLLAAVHHATAGDHEALEAFAIWSSRDPNYAGEAHKAVEHRWGTFKDRRDGSHVATIGTLLSAVETACRDAELLGEATARHHKALAAHRSLVELVAAKDLEELSDGGEAPSLLAWIESRPADWQQADPSALAKLIVEISEQPEIHWPDLTTALSTAIDGKLSPLKIQRLAQKEVTKRSEAAKDKRPTYAEVVNLISKATIKSLTTDPRDLAAPPNKQLYLYASGYWAKLADNAIDVATWEIIKRIVCLNGKSQRTLNKYAFDAADCTFREISTTEDRLYYKDEQPNCINLTNGTLWFQKDGTYRLKPHKREDLLTTQIPYAYDPEARCPSFDTMLEQVFECIAKQHSPAERADFIRHFWELIGYTIQPNKDLPVMMFWVGDGHNGKSKLADIIRGLIGKEAVLAVSVQTFFNPQNAHNTSALEGKLLVLDDDLRSGTMLNDGDLKKVSKNNPIEVNPKNKATKQITVQSTVLVITNTRVYLKDASPGFQRRIFATYFDKDISHLQNSPLPEIAERQEMPGILNKAVQGLARMRKRGNFDLPKSAKAFRARFLASSNSVIGFWESIEKHRVGGRQERTSELYDRYRAHMLLEGEGSAQSKADFVDALRWQAVSVNHETINGWSFGPASNKVTP